MATIIKGVWIGKTPYYKLWSLFERVDLTNEERLLVSQELLRRQEERNKREKHLRQAALSAAQKESSGELYRSGRESKQDLPVEFSGFIVEGGGPKTVDPYERLLTILHDYAVSVDSPKNSGWYDYTDDFVRLFEEDVSSIDVARIATFVKANGGISPSSWIPRDVARALNISGYGVSQKILDANGVSRVMDFSDIKHFVARVQYPKRGVHIENMNVTLMRGLQPDKPWAEEESKFWINAAKEYNKERRQRWMERKVTR